MKDENRVAARLLLIERVNEYIVEANLEPVVERRFGSNIVDHAAGLKRSGIPDLVLTKGLKMDSF